MPPVLKYSRAVNTLFFQNAPYTPTPYTFLDGCLVMFNGATRFDGTEPLILFMHGHGNVGSVASNASPAFPYFTHIAMEWARRGFIVASIDGGGGTGWPSPMVNAVMERALAWMKHAHDPTTNLDFTDGLGVYPGKHIMAGYSMGGGNAISFAKNHQADVAACHIVNPAINLDVFLPNPEMDMLYIPTGTTPYANKQGGTQAVSLTVPVNLTVVNGMNLPAGPGYLDVFRSNAVESCYYQSRDATHINQVLAFGNAFSCSNGNLLISAPNYTGHEGYNAIYDALHGQYSPANYHVPTRLIHGMADTTVIPSTIAAFLAAAANPGIQEVQYPTAGHVTIYEQMPDTDDIQFLAAAAALS